MESMDEVMIESTNGRSLRLSGCRPKDHDGIWAYDLAFRFGGGTASISAYEIGDGPARFFRELADSWAGFDGVWEYRSLEGNLVLACRHDGVGSVMCEITVRRPVHPVWDVRAEMEFGSGAHLERIASELEGLRSSG